jgi:hypothetical protein
MARATLLKIDSPERKAAELFIKTVYDSRYGAKLPDLFPSRLMAHVDEQGGIICAAGVRTERDGFFSEVYLDTPVDQILSATSGRKIRREEIFEVSTLASRAPKITPDFIREIVCYGNENGFIWSFFTLTHRLARLVGRLGLRPVYLADADPRRIEGRQQWGSYYASEPKVYAVSSCCPRPSSVRRDLGKCHANAV